MNLPTIDQLELSEKRVILRGDLDVDVESDHVVSAKRIEVLLLTINKLLEKNVSKITIIGHRGRPEGEVKEEFSLRPLANWFSEKLSQEVGFAESFESIPDNKIVLFENLRFLKGEEENSEGFVEQLAQLGEVYVNDAFGVSHREHASIIGLPKKMSKAAGLHLVEEVDQLSKVVDNPARPFVFLLDGVKQDKLSYLDKFIEISDMVLVGGRLPEYLDENYKHDKVIVAKLIQDKEDITLHSVEAFEKEISKAKTILLSGPVGKFEEEGHRLGTQKVFEAIANSSAYRVAGGGDTEAAIKLFELEDNFDWISTGGGAMLEFIAKGTLPGLQALLD